MSGREEYAVSYQGKLLKGWPYQSREDVERALEVHILAGWLIETDLGIVSRTVTDWEKDEL